MQCRDICEMLSPYIDGMLESSQAVQVEEHLAACAACRLEYDDLRAAVELVRELPEVVPPREFHEELRQKLKSLPGPAVTAGHSSRLNRVPWTKWAKTLAAAAVIFLAVGVTALWYDKNEGGVFDIATQSNTGQNTAYRGELPGGDKENDGVTPEAREQAVEKARATNDVLIANNDTPDVDRNEPEVPGMPLSERGAGTIADSGLGNQPPPVVGDEGVTAAPNADSGDTGADYSEVEKHTARDFPAPEEQPTGEDAMFSIMAAPRERFRDEANQLENGSFSVENDLHVAREYTVTLVLDTQQITEDQITEDLWNATAGEYGGYVEANPQQTGHCWVLRIPTSFADEFIDQLNGMGQVEIHSRTRDLADDMQQAQEQLNILWERENKLAFQLENVQKGKDTALLGELDELRGQIARQQQTITGLQQDIDLARVDLYLMLP